MRIRSSAFYGISISLLLFGIAVHLSVAQVPVEPAGLHLTWQFDPTTTMTIDWHTEPGDQSDHVLQYKRIGSSDWQDMESSSLEYPYSDRTIHRVEITGLEPDTEYRFRVGEFTREYKFRTMPGQLDRPIRFAVGGDTGRGETMRKVNRIAAQYDVEFVAWGGDLSYADGRAEEYERWHQWFENNMEGLITDDGRVIPILTAIGNHEMKRQRGGNYWFLFDDYEPTDQWRTANAPYFMQLFAFPGQPGYGVLDFGDYMSIFLLDSDHANPVKGRQTRWLEREMRERDRRGVTHIFPVYHIAAFPSHRSFTSRVQVNIREAWVPLFEKYGVRVAFEAHDHTYKRTHPILNEEISGDGIVYIGDGAWGVRPREGNNRDAWYINQFASNNHAIIVTLDGKTQEYIVVDEEGNVFDNYTDDRSR